MDALDRENQISSLWQRVFDEEKEVTSLFLKEIYPVCENPVVEIDEKIISSIFLIPCKIENYNGLYVYCAMTDELYRGKKLMESLLKRADEIVKEKSLDFILLVPASESLFNYYKKFGFENFGYNFKVDQIESYTEISEKYSAIRSFNGTELKFSNEIIDYWAKVTKIYGGKIIKINEDFCLLGDEVLDAKNGEIRHNVAMIKTENTKLKNTQTFIGITLE